jgi:LPXTG-motif cell wall-anchored protein
MVEAIRDQWVLAVAGAALVALVAWLVIRRR